MLESISRVRKKVGQLSLRAAAGVALGITALALGAVACGSGESSGLQVTFSERTATPAPGGEVRPSPLPLPVVRGLLMPIEGACLPASDSLMPNASRDYREGIHEGIDFYGLDNCVDIGRGTKVRAAKVGRVVRADHDYQDLTAEALADLEERVGNGETKSPEVLDAFRGRQVWLDHGGGVVTRYAHLSAVADGIQVGMVVEAGTVIGYVGDSGTPESVSAPGAEDHVHFEVRVGRGYLGQGLPPAEVRTLYEEAFAPEEAP